MVIFCPKKSCLHSTGIFSFFLGLTTRHSLSFQKLRDRAALLVWKCICDLSMILGVLIYLFQFFFCGIMAFYVSISDAVFLVTSYPIFDNSVWLIL